MVGHLTCRSLFALACQNRPFINKGMLGLPNQSEIDEIGLFLRQRKVLTSTLPNWSPTTRPNVFDARWLIENENGVSVSNARFRHDFSGHTSISLIHRNRSIWRLELDFAPGVRRHSNPPGADELELPADVDGNHEHRWPDNSEYVKSCGFGELPYRRPLPPQVRQFRQAMGFFFREVGVITDANTWNFDTPPDPPLL